MDETTGTSGWLGAEEPKPWPGQEAQHVQRESIGQGGAERPCVRRWEAGGGREERKK